MDQQQPADIYQDFRQDLKVTAAVVKKLAPHCKSPDEIVAMCELGITNEGQCSLLLDLVAPVQFRKQ